MNGIGDQRLRVEVDSSNPLGDHHGNVDKKAHPGDSHGWIGHDGRGTS